MKADVVLTQIDETTEIKNVKNTPVALKQACQEFESFFIYYMLKVMRQTVPKVDLIDGGLAKEIYTSLLDEQLAKKVSEGGGIGLAKLLLRQFTQNQVLNSVSPEHSGEKDDI
ncbi:MAG: rod-binding protein [Candidatus Desulfofervidaceae bacterium]|nr:rod-binding protein [Candidatus Desulfofervidaceae bacterium]